MSTYVHSMALLEPKEEPMYVSYLYVVDMALVITALLHRPS